MAMEILSVRKSNGKEKENGRKVKQEAERRSEKEKNTTKEQTGKWEVKENEYEWK